jgi:expansin (peptidoglycan-binding protein)
MTHRIRDRRAYWVAILQIIERKSQILTLDTLSGTWTSVDKPEWTHSGASASRELLLTTPAQAKRSRK